MTSSSSSGGRSFRARPKLASQLWRLLLWGLVSSAGSLGLAGADSPGTAVAPSSKLTRTDFLREAGGSCEALPEASDMPPEGDAARGGLVRFMADFRGELDRGGGECLTVRFSTGPKCVCRAGLPGRRVRSGEICRALSVPTGRGSSCPSAEALT